LSLVLLLKLGSRLANCRLRLINPAWCGHSGWYSRSLYAFNPHLETLASTLSDLSALLRYRSLYCILRRLKYKMAVMKIYGTNERSDCCMTGVDG
jgi:hypothetical protein